jgi:hypothetical protein
LEAADVRRRIHDAETQKVENRLIKEYVRETWGPEMPMRIKGGGVEILENCWHRIGSREEVLDSLTYEPGPWRKPI